jgi:phage-related tail protein
VINQSLDQNKTPLDAKTVKHYETIRTQQVILQEQITKIKTLEEEIMNPLLYAESVRKGFISVQADENAKLTTLEEIHCSLGWPVA